MPAGPWKRHLLFPCLSTDRKKLALQRWKVLVVELIQGAVQEDWVPWALG